MVKTADTCGLSCPQPVILARKAIKEGQFPIEALVETVTSCENVRRAAAKMGCQVQIDERGDESALTLSR